jgi:serine/threonine protein kinase
MPDDPSSRPSEIRPAPYDAAIEPMFEAVREATSGTHEILGELARDLPASAAFLARDLHSRELVVLRLAREHAAAGGGAESYVAEEVTELNSSVPAPPEMCQVCHAPTVGWARQCVVCGTDVTGVAAGGESGRTAAELLEEVRRQAAGHYAVLGAMRRSEGGGLVYFARAISSGSLVMLRLFDAPAGGTRSYTLAVTPVILTQPGGGPATPPALPTLRTRASDARPATVTRSPAQGKVCPQCGAEFGSAAQFCPHDGQVLRSKTSRQDLVGQVLGDRYLVLQKLGEGGMGEVYLAEHVKIGRRCAVKVMRRALMSDPDAAGRFRREAQNASRISHPNIATIYDFGETRDGVVYLAMEYIHGRTLSEILAYDGALPSERAVSIARQVADALGAAHDLGIVHRDLKPDNIMVAQGRDGSDIIKVVDFGIAKAMMDLRGQLTRTGFVLGTPAYMSPEQIIGDPLDGRSDLYSLGCILFEMLTGQVTFAGASGESMVNRRLSEPPPHPRRVNGRVSKALDEVVVKMLARSPVDRYQTAAELTSALAAAISSTGRPWMPRFDWLPGASAQEPRSKAPTPPAPSFSSRSVIVRPPTRQVTPPMRHEGGATIPVPPRSPSVAAPRWRPAMTPPPLESTPMSAAHDWIVPPQDAMPPAGTNAQSPWTVSMPGTFAPPPGDDTAVRTVPSRRRRRTQEQPSQRRAVLGAIAGVLAIAAALGLVFLVVPRRDLPWVGSHTADTVLASAGGTTVDTSVSNKVLVLPRTNPSDSARTAQPPVDTSRVIASPDTQTARAVDTARAANPKITVTRPESTTVARSIGPQRNVAEEGRRAAFEANMRGFQADSSAAGEVRGRAVQAGATAQDLALGDSLMRTAVDSASRRRLVSARAAVQEATRRFEYAEKVAAGRKAMAAAVQAQEAQLKASHDSLMRAELDKARQSAEAYLQAIRARDTSAVRQIYPGMGSATAAAFAALFDSATVINVKLTEQPHMTAADGTEVLFGYTIEFSPSIDPTQQKRSQAFRATVVRTKLGWRVDAEEMVQ